MQTQTASKIRVLLLENIHSLARDLLVQQGCEVELMKSALAPDALSDKLKDFQVLGVRSKTVIPASVFEKCPSLFAVGCFCVGTAHVDLESAKKHGVPVFNAPYSNTRSVAEMVLSHIIALSRQIGLRNLEMHRGVWNKKSDGCFEVRGKTLGIVGYGNIGTQISALAEAVGLRVVFYDVQTKLTLGNAKQYPELETVLRESDFITLHVPDTAMTRGMIGAEEMAMMKKGAYLINASRGTVVDVDALAKAIQEKHLGGAAIDVYPEEPEGNTDKFKSPLLGLPNVILTPHIGGATEEAQSSIGREVASNLMRHISEGTTEGAVNVPIVEPLPPTGKIQRLLNVHRNVPGVLKDINRIVSAAGANIQSQQLATDPHVGFLVIDFDRPLAAESIRDIETLGASIRTRILS